MFVKVTFPDNPQKIFEYKVPKKLLFPSIKIGVRVLAPFRNTRKVGIVVSLSNKNEFPAEKIKEIEEMMDSSSLFSDDLLFLCEFASHYYHESFHEILIKALPKQLKKIKSNCNAIIKNKLYLKKEREPVKIALTSEQNHLANQILEKDGHHVHCLYGVTGSGKTEIYFHCIEAVLKQHKQVLFLLPEIGLAPQTTQRFLQRFGEKHSIATLHSGISETLRKQSWMQAHAHEVEIVIGTRLSVFTPFHALGLIIIDEEHDLSFKQQEGFRYHARDLAIARAKKCNIPIILGSATPSLETLYNAKKGKYQFYQLASRNIPVESESASQTTESHPSPVKKTYMTQMPDINVIDLKKERTRSGLSMSLLSSIENHLKKKGQVLLFLNRRGYAPLWMCHSCGWQAKCEYCDANLTLHKEIDILWCHHCDHKQALKEECHSCLAPIVTDVGVGTEKVAHYLMRHFPTIPIKRIDRDTTQKKDSFLKLHEEILQGEPQILIGTQMLAKGHHFPNVTLVGVLNADQRLYSPDFRGSERFGQLLVQVSGRAGRAEKKGEVFIQTAYPNHPLLTTLLKEGYLAFAETLLNLRKKTELPPYTFQALFRARHPMSEKGMTFLNQIKSLLQRALPNTIQLLGPMPHSLFKKARFFRWQLLLLSQNRKDLHALLNTFFTDESTKTLLSSYEKDKNLFWSLDVDPYDL